MVGGSGGLGLAVARMLAVPRLGRRRDLPVATPRRPTRSSRRRAAGACAPSAHQLDVTDAAACAAVVAAVARRTAACTPWSTRPARTSRWCTSRRSRPRTWPRSSTQDAVGFFNVVQPALPHLRAAEGSIVAVTTAATAASRSATGSRRRRRARSRRWSAALAAEEGRFGVRVNAVGPGMLTDGMAARLIASGELSDDALAVTRAQHPAAPLRHRRRHRRGGLLPRLRPGRLHLRAEARRRRRLRASDAPPASLAAARPALLAGSLGSTRRAGRGVCGRRRRSSGG